ncbi:hypothetical protein [Anatilimnocola floriformis]|uniref:hypothetical protein n=1 Tax=Anatilimnocola floriformis TaxID=2948575 RepID=UPI0020C24F7C|nr:hypothetical protein [Anatilimnocola floriformis]
MLRSLATFAFAVLAVVQTASAQTQQQWQQQMARMRQQGQQIQWENTDFSGNIKGTQGPLLQITASTGENWIVQVDARPQDVSFTGNADPAFLKAGMLVEFKAKLNKRGQATEPVQNLTIITVREGRGVGVGPEGASGGLAGANLFGSKPEESEKEKKGPKVKEEDVVQNIAGQITKVGRTGDLTINCAGTTVKADVAKDAKISVDVNHLQFAQVGDKVEVKAKFPMGQKAAGQALATQITVTSTALLGEPKKRTLPGMKTDDDKKE